MHYCPIHGPMPEEDRYCAECGSALQPDAPGGDTVNVLRNSAQLTASANPNVNVTIVMPNAASLPATPIVAAAPAPAGDHSDWRARAERAEARLAALAGYLWKRGVDSYHRGRYAEALADYDAAIEAGSQDAAVFADRGAAHYRLGSYALAIADYDTAIRMAPAVVWVYGARGAAYRKSGDYDRAIADHSHGLELDPGQAWVYEDRGLAHRALGRHERALADLSRAIELDGRNGELYHLRSLCYRSLGDLAHADADQARARELGYKG